MIRNPPNPHGIHPDKLRLIAWTVWSAVVLAALALAMGAVALVAVIVELAR